jgi:hypothetical protein
VVIVVVAMSITLGMLSSYPCVCRLFNGVLGLSNCIALNDN